MIVVAIIGPKVPLGQFELEEQVCGDHRSLRGGLGSHCKLVEASSESTVEAGLSSPPVIGIWLTSYELMSIR
jgi:hypothetical protein